MSRAAVDLSMPTHTYRGEVLRNAHTRLTPGDLVVFVQRARLFGPGRVSVVKWSDGRGEPMGAWSRFHVPLSDLEVLR